LNHPFTLARPHNRAHMAWQPSEVTMRAAIAELLSCETSWANLQPGAPGTPSSGMSTTCWIGWLLSSALKTRNAGSNGPCVNPWSMPSSVTRHIMGYVCGVDELISFLQEVTPTSLPCQLFAVVRADAPGLIHTSPFELLATSLNKRCTLLRDTCTAETTQASMTYEVQWDDASESWGIRTPSRLCTLLRSTKSSAAWSRMLQAMWWRSVARRWPISEDLTYQVDEVEMRGRVEGPMGVTPVLIRQIKACRRMPDTVAMEEIAQEDADLRSQGHQSEWGPCYVEGTLAALETLLEVTWRPYGPRGPEQRYILPLTEDYQSRPEPDFPDFDEELVSAWTVLRLTVFPNGLAMEWRVEPFHRWTPREGMTAQDMMQRLLRVSMLGHRDLSHRQ
jgi:hypothetical protein